MLKGNFTVYNNQFLKLNYGKIVIERYLCFKIKAVYWGQQKTPY